MAKKNDYFGLGRIVSLILAIIPVTCWILGIVTRINEKKYIAGVIRIFLGFNIIWIADIVCMALNKKIARVF